MPPAQTPPATDDLEAAWIDLRRAAPDQTAPNVPALPVRLILSLFAYLALIPTLLVVIPFFTLRHITIGPPLAWQPLSTYIQGRLVYWSGRISDSAFLRPPPPGGKIPSNLPLRWAKEGRANVECEVVDLEPVGNELRRGIGKMDGVTAEKRWGYLLTPPGSAGKGTNPATDGEKVIIYFHGG